MIENPVAAATMFYRLLEKFFKIIVKLPINAFTGKQMQLHDLIVNENSKETGAFGKINAYLGVIEEQKGGNLHLHALLFGAWVIRMFQQ